MGSSMTNLRVIKETAEFKKHISAIVITDYLHPGGDNVHYIKRFNEIGDCIWSIDNIRGRYKLILSSGVRKDYYKKEMFLDSLKKSYPGDFDFFLWHPEVLEGTYEWRII